MSCKRLFGFTLIEVLLVVIIFSIIAGLTIPSLGNFRRKFVLKSTAYEIVSLMQLAQLRALSQNAELRMTASVDYSYFWLERKETNGYARLSGRLSKPLSMPSDIRITVDGLPVAFFPDGAIGSAEMALCNVNDCFLISTKEQYAAIKISEWTAE